MMPLFARCVGSLAYSILFLCMALQLACERPHPAELDAYISREDDRWLQNVIPVCFEQAHGYEKDRAIIQQIVSSEFARADIHFDGWNVCRENDQGIRISFDENAGMSHTKKIGRLNAGLAQNLVMGLKSRCAGIFSGSLCASNIALHEFGHALGLHHEMNRRDNESCAQDQTNGEGEDALQLGPYDTQSIMDYCFLYAANARREGLRLSEQDVAALKALHSGLVASLDQSVPMVIKEVWTAYVKGLGLSAYRFALGSKQNLACDQLSSYSQSLPLEEAISIDPHNFGHDPATVMTLCLLGENASGQQQDLNSYSAIDFRIVSSAIIASSGPTPPRLVQNPHMDRQNQWVVLQLELAPGLPLRSLHASLAYTQSSIYHSIQNTRFESKDLGSGRYQLFFKAEDFPANGEVYVSSLELTDILGQKLSLFSGAAWTSFFEHEWISPALSIDWSYENDAKGPSILQINAFYEEWEAGAEGSFTMVIEENSRLQNIRLVLRSDNSSLEPAINWQRLHDQTYRIELEIPQQTVNGSYRLDSLSFEDIMGNRRDYSLDAASNTLYGTKIPAPALTVKNGLAYDGKPPQLMGIRIVGTQFKRNQKVFVDLDIIDESSLKSVRLSLRHVSDQGFYKTIYGLDLGEIAGTRRIELNTTKDHPLGEFAIYEIAIEDRFGHTSRYELDPHNPGFLTGGLPVSSIELIDP